MTKVLMSTGLLAYQRRMKETLRQVVQQNSIAGIHQAEWAETVLAQKDLLPPPCILAISLEGYKGEGDDLIGIWVDHDFGIASMHVTIRDLQGNTIEKGDAYPFSESTELWWFFPVVCIPHNTAVTVEVTAMDGIGSVARWRKGKTMGEEEEF
jgi:hypothetical protein